uniref:Uncharacterized protein n=1 Tax=Helianthus annuus TaxID=4232 RepID=A0A251TRR2_HELAN
MLYFPIFHPLPQFCPYSMRFQRLFQRGFNAEGKLKISDLVDDSLNIIVSIDCNCFALE